MATLRTTLHRLLLAFALCGAASAALPADVPPPQAAAAAVVRTQRGAPAEVRFMNRTVVTLHADISGATSEARARRATEQLERLDRSEWSLPVGTLPMSVDGVDVTGIRLGDRLLFVVSRGDVAPDDARDFEAVVADIQARLRAALDARNEFGRWRTFLRGLGFSVAATALLGGLIKLLIAGRQQLQRRLERLVEQRIAESGRSRMDWANSVLQVVARLLRMLLGGAVLVLSFGWLTFVLKQFVFTQPVGDRLSGFFVELLVEIGQAMLDALPDLLTIFVIFVLAKAFRDLLGTFFDNVARGSISVPGLHPDTIHATSRIASGLVWVLGFAFAYPYIPGSQTDVFKGLSVLAGLVLTLGSSSVVNQLMCGMTLVYSRSLRKGELVRIGDVIGIVEEVNALSVKLLRVNEEITVPNAVVVGNTVRNFSRATRGRTAVYGTAVTIGYDTPWRRVHDLLERAVADTAGIVRAPQPLILQRALSDFFVEYELQVTLADAAAYVDVMSRLHANILDRFNDDGVQIMSPHFAFQPVEPVVARWRDGADALRDRTG